MAERKNSTPSEVFTTLKGYFHALTEGERTPTEVASAFNEWAREGAESVKAKIAEEVEATVLKMGFIKREEYDELLARVAKLESKSSAKVKTERSTVKVRAQGKTKATPAKKVSPPKKKAVKK